MKKKKGTQPIGMSAYLAGTRQREKTIMELSQLPMKTKL